MRWKIIAVNSVIVLIVGLLTYALLRTSLGAVASNQGQLREQADRSLSAAISKLELDSLRIERWLSAVANDKASRDPFKAGTANARYEAARDLANRVRGASLSSSQFAHLAPTLVAVVDAGGTALGRDGSNLLRGEDIGSAHPSLVASLSKGVPASDVWADAKTSELMLVSYAPVRDDDGKVLGGILLGTPFNDERLQRTSEQTSGRGLIVGIPGQTLSIKAKSAQVSTSLISAVGQPPVSDEAMSSAASGRTTFLSGAPVDYLLAAAPLTGYGDGKRAILIAVGPASLLENLNSQLWPVFAVTGLGLLMVCIAGFLLGNYLSRPIEQIEEGLLAILNGKSDLRFEIEHPDFGGLGFRLNSLLNQLMGVQEDDTDEDGRPSRPPSAEDFTEALAVDERSMEAPTLDPSALSALRSQPADAYYRQLFRAYVDAKRSIGDPVGHLTEASFVARIRASEADMRDRHGKDVRYQVELRGREIVLMAVPLS